MQQLFYFLLCIVLLNLIRFARAKSCNNVYFRVLVCKQKLNSKKSGAKWWNVGKNVYLCSEMRFLGNIEAKTDAKGRVFFPATVRKVLQASGQEKLVMRQDFFKPCLVLYPESVWNEMMDTMRSRLNRFNEHHRRIFREFVSGAEEVTLDGNGRFLIPRPYLEQASIKQDVWFLGVDDSVEVWALEKVAEERMDDKEFGQALQDVMGMAF